jgi:hypothetical protein
MIDYLDSLADVTAEQLDGGFFVGWPNPPSPANHLRMLMQSDVIMLARNDDQQVVGFITAITDGVSCAYIPHLRCCPLTKGRASGRRWSAACSPSLSICT